MAMNPFDRKRPTVADRFAVGDKIRSVPGDILGEVVSIQQRKALQRRWPHGGTSSVCPLCMKKDEIANTKLSPAQVKALDFARWRPLRDGTIEQSLQLDLSGAALDAVIDALERKGLVDAQGALTEKGVQVIDFFHPREQPSPSP